MLPLLTRPRPALTVTPAQGARGSRTVPSLVAVAVFVLYTAFALRQHHRFETTGYDLGIFEQAVRAYAELRPPASEIRTASAPPGFSGEAYPLLGDHFHPILILLAPLYLLVPHVETLLVAQAGLVAWSTYVVSRAARRHLPQPGAAVSLGLAYGCSWGLQQLIGFDFHEVAFAVPLLALACAAYLDGRWTAAAWWAAGLLLVKEDLGATAALLGLLLMRRQRRVGLTLFLSASAATVLIVGVVIPALAPDGRYGYLTQQYAYGPFEGLPIKALTLMALLVITAGLATRSPLVLLMVPTLAWRLTSPNPAYWNTELHYSAVLMPIAFLALIDVLRRGVTWPPVSVPLVVAVLLMPTQPLSSLATPDFWRDSPRQAAARTAVSLIPDGARVAASNNLAPHLTGRATVHLVSEGVLSRRPDVNWIAADAHEGFPPGAFDSVLRAAAEEGGWRRVYADDGVLVLQRRSG
ncbi:DUF2079 domain-containing protein [Streptomyces sp. NPDC000410]|uniref:DUF2079 domain-containing protein n=1 Tax=Streptomyces sp. NPDC000410 TaxID=3154254 RepID=UPI0033179080